MKAIIKKKTKDLLIIDWSKPKVGFGQLTMTWDSNKQYYILDSELMAVDTVIEIIKALK